MQKCKTCKGVPTYDFSFSEKKIYDRIDHASELVLEISVVLHDIELKVFEDKINTIDIEEKINNEKIIRGENSGQICEEISQISNRMELERSRDVIPNIHPLAVFLVAFVITAPIVMYYPQGQVKDNVKRTMRRSNKGPFKTAPRLHVGQAGSIATVNIGYNGENRDDRPESKRFVRESHNCAGINKKPERKEEGGSEECEGSNFRVKERSERK